MSERAKKFMELVWNLRNEEADTEEKLVAGIVKLVAESCEYYHAQISSDKIITVIDKENILKFSDEIKLLNNES